MQKKEFVPKATGKSVIRVRISKGKIDAVQVFAITKGVLLQGRWTPALHLCRATELRAFGVTCDNDAFGTFDAAWKRIFKADEVAMLERDTQFLAIDTDKIEARATPQLLTDLRALTRALGAFQVEGYRAIDDQDIMGVERALIKEHGGVLVCRLASFLDEAYGEVAVRIG